MVYLKLCRVLRCVVPVRLVFSSPRRRRVLGHARSFGREMDRQWSVRSEFKTRGERYSSIERLKVWKRGELGEGSCDFME